MDPEGHERIAIEAGLPLLREALGETNELLSEFYLGNWLSDVSQVNNPAGYACAVSGLDTWLTELIDQASGTLFAEPDRTTRMPRSVGELIRTETESAKRGLVCGLRGSLLTPEEGDTQPPAIAFLRELVFVTGYFKFVHPAGAGRTPHLAFDRYCKIFRSAGDRGAFSGYYPLDHLDRPPTKICPDEYVARHREGSVPGTRSPRRREPMRPDMYPYIRDAMEIVAGTLAEVDQEFTKAMGVSGQQQPEIEGGVLSKLGHAMHVLEDFFAHSNWVELALPALGKRSLDAANRAWSHGSVRSAESLFERRQAELIQGAPGDSPQHEQWVVTGYFDGQDTLFSLGHKIHHLIDSDSIDALRSPVGTSPLGVARRVIAEMLDLLTDPQSALEDRDNGTARRFVHSNRSRRSQLVEKPTDPDIVRLVLEASKLLDAVDGAARIPLTDAMIRALTIGSSVYNAGAATWPVYRCLRYLREIMSTPGEWIKRHLIPTWLQRGMSDLVSYLTEEYVLESLGAYRPGCHTLLAKDAPEALYYDQAMKCATALQWYVVKTLVRDHNEPALRRPIDWLELVEHFLRHPASASGVRRVSSSTTLRHTIRDGEQLRAKDPRKSLEAIYRPTAVAPGSFSWRSIADANFGTWALDQRQTQQVINETLKAKAWGVPVRTPNYAFKPGVSIRIPDQRVQIEMSIAQALDERWFAPVLNGTAWTDSFEFERYKDTKTYREYVKGRPGFEHRPIVIKDTEAAELIERGNELRRMTRAKQDRLAAEIVKQQIEACRSDDDALDELDELLRERKTQLPPADAELLERIRRLRRVLGSLYQQAADAFDHYLRGSSQPTQIEPAYAAYVRDRSGPYHSAQLMRILRRGMGQNPPAAAARLALEALTRDGVALPAEQWPDQHQIAYEFRYTSGQPDTAGALFEQAITLGRPDWIVTYLNGEISSSVKINARRVGTTRRYSLRIEDWKSWVVDNFDWASQPLDSQRVGGVTSLKRLLEYDRKGMKRYGGIAGQALGIPSNHELRQLDRLLGAKPYARSSVAWQVTSQMDEWVVSFEPDTLVSSLAKKRLAFEKRQRLADSDRNHSHVAIPPAWDILRHNP